MAILITAFDHLPGDHLGRLAVMTMADCAGALAVQKMCSVSGTKLLGVAGNSSYSQSRGGQFLTIKRANISPVRNRVWRKYTATTAHQCGTIRDMVAFFRRQQCFRHNLQRCGNSWFAHVWQRKFHDEPER